MCILLNHLQITRNESVVSFTLQPFCQMKEKAQGVMPLFNIYTTPPHYVAHLVITNSPSLQRTQPLLNNPVLNRRSFNKCAFWYQRKCCLWNVTHCGTFVCWLGENMETTAETQQLFCCNMAAPRWDVTLSSVCECILALINWRLMTSSV